MDERGSKLTNFKIFFETVAEAGQDFNLLAQAIYD